MIVAKADDLQHRVTESRLRGGSPSAGDNSFVKNGQLSVEQLVRVGVHGLNSGRIIALQGDDGVVHS
jgi:hypothetical protein